jgi:type IV pilus assembly protein PilP
MRRAVGPRGGVLAIAAALLAACAPSGEDELRQWMQAERDAISPSTVPIPEPVRFEPKAYTVAHLPDPFSSEKLASVLRGVQGPPALRDTLVQPEFNRRKEPLEAYPLGAMAMVGSMERQGERVALVKVDNLLYQVRVGQHLGQNFGKVVRITETEVQLREIVQDAAGDWVEQSTSLQLQEDPNP